MTSKLKPCPFCGGEAKVREIMYMKYDGYQERFYISECQCCNVNIEADNKEDAITAWNTRKPMDKIVEQLERLPNVNSDYWNFADLIDREDAIEIVREVQNEGQK